MRELNKKLKDKNKDKNKDNLPTDKEIHQATMEITQQLCHEESGWLVSILHRIYEEGFSRGVREGIRISMKYLRGELDE